MISITKKIETLNSFDNITKFRLINAFLIAIGFNLFFPILIDLKGEYLAAWLISIFMILETLMVKTNQFFIDNFTMSDIYKMTVVLHGLVTLVAITYFLSPIIMIYLESIFSIFDIAVFSAFSIQLSNHIAENYPENMSKYQIFRNSIWADGILIGLVATTLLTFLFGNGSGLIFFIIFNLCFTLWLISKWNYIYIEIEKLEIK